MTTTQTSNQLREWLTRNGRTISWLQRETGLSYPGVHAIVHGQRCHKATAELIHEAVAREITVEDLMDGR